MEFLDVARRDNGETGAVEISAKVSSAAVKDQLSDFYEVVAPHQGLKADASWDDVDAAAMQSMGADRYRELRRDFVVNRLVSEALATCGVVPALTPRIHAVDYPEPYADYSFEVSIVERPRLVLTSCEPVEIETDDAEVTDALIDARIAEFLEAHAEYSVDVPRPVAYGDCVRVDMATLREGKTVPRLTGKSMILELAKGAMPESFVEGFVGTKVGETRVVDYAVRRPQALAADDVDGYTATVTVVEQLKKAVPKLTDEWVDENVESASSVADLRKGVARGLEVEVAQFNRDTHARLANIELAKRLQGIIPEEFYQVSRTALANKLERELSEKGQTLDDYLEQEHMNEEELSMQTFIQSAENLRQGFALEALFDGRGMSLSDEDLEYACEQAFGKETYDRALLERTGRFSLVESSAKRMVALNWLADTAVVREG